MANTNVSNQADISDAVLGIFQRQEEKNIKIRAFFTQKVATSGSFSFLPTISFHAVIPDDSKVFQFVREGNLEGLVGLLKDGLASLTDCDTQGRSLLWVKLSNRDKYIG